MLARVKATGEIVEVYERYDDLAMESTYTELARIYHPDELDLDIPAEPVNPQSALNQEEYAVSPQPTLSPVTRFLTVSEIAEIQWMPTVLSHLSAQLSAIALAVSRRHAIVSVLRRDTAAGDSSRLAALAAISSGIRHEEFPDINLLSTIEDIDEDIGKKGPVLWTEAQVMGETLKNISEKICRMCSITPPQTIFDLHDLSRLTCRLSSDGKTHGQTGTQGWHDSTAHIQEESHGQKS